MRMLFVLSASLCAGWLVPLLLAGAPRAGGGQDGPIENEPFKSEPLPPLHAIAAAHLPTIVTGPPAPFRIIALPTNFSASGVNNRGQVVGTWDTSRRKNAQNPITKAAVWQEGRVRLFPAPGAEPDCSGATISDTGIIGGKAGEDGGEPYWASYDAVLWNTASGHPVARSIGHLPALSSAFIAALNDRGQAVGVSEPSYFGESRPYLTPDLRAIDQTNGFFWDGQKLLNLGRGAAHGINARGQVVGTQNGKIVLWAGSEKRILGDGIGYAINNRGQILATLSKPSGELGSAKAFGEALLYQKTVTLLEHCPGMNAFGREASMIAEKSWARRVAQAS